ncbi:beta barrel domain-containing protein [Streptosporangium sp. G12]
MAYHVGQEVRVFDVDGAEMGQPEGGWPGKVIKVGRRYATVSYRGRTGQFLLGTGRINDAYGHQWIMTLEQVEALTSEPERIEYACRFTAWTNTDGIEKQVVKYDFTGTGDSGLSEARRMVRDTRAWQPRQNLPVDAVVVSRPVPEWAVVPDPPAEP